MSDSDDDDVPQLSSHTVAALQEFYAEQKQHPDPSGDDKYIIGVIEENWVCECVRVSQEALVCNLFRGQSSVCLCPANTQIYVTCPPGPDNLFGELNQQAVCEYFKTA